MLEAELEYSRNMLAYFRRHTPRATMLIETWLKRVQELEKRLDIH